MTSVAVQSLVIDPIWKTESAVAVTPVALLSTPAAPSTTSPSLRTAQAAAGTSYFSSSAGTCSASQRSTSGSFVMDLTLGTGCWSVLVAADNSGGCGWSVAP